MIVNAGKVKLLVRKRQAFAGCGVLESYTTQRRIEVLFGVKAGEYDGLIANQSGASIDGMGITALGFEVGLGMGHIEFGKRPFAVSACNSPLTSLRRPGAIDISTDGNERAHDTSWEETAMEQFLVKIPMNAYARCLAKCEEGSRAYMILRNGIVLRDDPHSNGSYSV